MQAPRSNRIRLVVMAVVGAILVPAIAGCDANESADLDNGRQLFIAECGVCHYLNEAGTSSDIGPDLDSAFAAARASGQDQDTFEGVIEAQIANPRQVDESDPSYMPRNLVEGDDLTDVSAYVASVAGVPGIEPPTAPGGPGDNGSASSSSRNRLAPGRTASPMTTTSRRLANRVERHPPGSARSISGTSARRSAT